jgi:hypothetical protein
VFNWKEEPMVEFSSGDVSQVAKIPPGVFHTWLKAGLLGPTYASVVGHGNHRKFGISQLLAVAVGAAYRREGASLGRVAGVVRFLGGCQIEWIEAELAAGRTVPVPADFLREYGVELILRPGIMVALDEVCCDVPGAKKLAAKLDMLTIYQNVKRGIEKLSRRPTKTGPGRKRGTVAN